MNSLLQVGLAAALIRMKEKMFGNCGGFGFNAMVLWTEHLCSLNLSLRHHLVSAMHCKWQRLYCITDLSAT